MANGRGGWRPGSGRKPGSRARKVSTVIAEATANNRTPLQHMVEVMNDPNADPHRRAPSQVFRVSVSDGVPQQAEQVYGNDGGEIAAASVGASAGNRLLIGSNLDSKLLSCTQK